MTDETATGARDSRREYLGAVQQAATALHAIPGYQGSPLQRADCANMAKAVLCHLIATMLLTPDFRPGHGHQGLIEATVTGPFFDHPFYQVPGHLTLGVRVFAGVRAMPFLQFNSDDDTGHSRDHLLVVIVDGRMEFSDAARHQGVEPLKPVLFGPTQGHTTLDPGAQAAANAIYDRLRDVYGEHTFPGAA